MALKPSRGKVKYPSVKVDLTRIDGNAYSILAAVCRAMRRAGVSQIQINKYRREAKSGDYDHLIQTTMRWVDA